MTTPFGKAMLALALVAAPATSWADSSHLSAGTMFNSSADTMINPSYAGTNFGNLPELSVGNGSAMLVRFDGPPSTGLILQGAILTFFVNKTLAAGTLNIARVTSSWTESGVTYATAPTVDTSTAITVPVSASATFVTVDVSVLVRDQLANGNYGFEITADASAPSTSVVIDSKESTTTAHPAVLQFAWALMAQAGVFAQISCSSSGLGGGPCQMSYTLSATCPANYFLVGVPVCERPTSSGFRPIPTTDPYDNTIGKCVYSGTVNANITENLATGMVCGRPYDLDIVIVR